MGSIVLLDAGITFDGRTPRQRAMGGAESSVVNLAEALSEIGHEVVVCNKCDEPVDYKGVAWRPLNGTVPRADRYIVNRDPRLLDLLGSRAPVSLWIHNDARYLAKPRFAIPLLRHRPVAVFLGQRHADTNALTLARCARRIVPLAVAPCFRQTPRPDKAPPPMAIYASHPERGLDPLLDIWAKTVQPLAPSAEFHLFTSAQFHGVANKATDKARPIIEKALNLDRVVLRAPLPRQALAEAYMHGRVMLYWGDEAHAETFCLSIAEAQAAGVPCIARPIGAVAERVLHSETGFLVDDPHDFAEAAVSLLKDDDLWRRQSDAARAHNALTWQDIAMRFDALHA